MFRESDALQQLESLLQALMSTDHSHLPMTMSTTLEAAAEFGYFTQAEAAIFLSKHDLTWEEAFKELGDSVLDAEALCIWIGY